jgi:hypothetical protein
MSRYSACTALVLTVGRRRRAGAVSAEHGTCSAVVFLATATAPVHHRCITGTAFDGLLRHGGQGEHRMVEPNNTGFAQNPAYAHVRVNKHPESKLARVRPAPGAVAMVGEWASSDEVPAVRPSLRTVGVCAGAQPRTASRRLIDLRFGRALSESWFSQDSATSALNVASPVREAPRRPTRTPRHPRSAPGSP